MPRRPAAPTPSRYRLSRQLMPVESGPGAGDFVHSPTGSGLVYPGDAFGSWVDNLVAFQGKLSKAGASRVMGNFYSTITNIGGYAGRGELKPGKFSWGYLRQVRQDNSLAKLIISVRMYQATRYSNQVLEPGKQIGWRVEHKDSFDDKVNTGSAAVEKRRKAVVEYLRHPAHTPIHHNLTDVFGILANDYLTYGRVALVRLLDSSHSPASWCLLDPTTVRHLTAMPNPDIEKLGYTSQDEIRAQAYSSNQYMQPQPLLAGVKPVPLKGKVYGQFVDGMMRAAWDDAECSVGMINRRSELNYGYNGEGVIEQVAELLDAWLAVFRWNEANYQRTYPDNILFFPGTDVAGAALDEWANEAKVISQGMNGVMLAPIGSRDEMPELVQLGVNPKDMEHSQNFLMLTSLILAAFQMHPSELNLSPWQGGQGVPLNGASQSDSLKEQKSAGEDGLIKIIEQFITEAIIEPFDADFRLRIDTELVDPSAKAQEMETMGASGLSLNQVLNTYGYDQRDQDPLADLPLSQAYFGYWAADQQQKAQQQQMQAQQDAAQQQGQPDDGSGQPQPPPPPDPNQQAAIEQKSDEGDANRAHDQQMQEMQQAHEKEVLKLKQAHELKLARLKGGATASKGKAGASK